MWLALHRTKPPLCRYARYDVLGYVLWAGLLPPFHSAEPHPATEVGWWLGPHRSFVLRYLEKKPAGLNFAACKGLVVSSVQA